MPPLCLVLVLRVRSGHEHLLVILHAAGQDKLLQRSLRPLTLHADELAYHTLTRTPGLRGDGRRPSGRWRALGIHNNSPLGVMSSADDSEQKREGGARFVEMRAKLVKLLEAASGAPKMLGVCA